MDGPPACSIGEEVGGLYELWNTDGTDIISTDKIDRADEAIILSPPKGGTKFRYFQINPYQMAYLMKLCKKWLQMPLKKLEQATIE